LFIHALLFNLFVAPVRRAVQASLQSLLNDSRLLRLQQVDDVKQGAYNNAKSRKQPPCSQTTVVSYQLG
jgi:hypothetical protein